MDSNNENDITKPPKVTREGKAYEIIKKSALSAIPIVGGIVETFIDEVYRPPSQRRRDDWIRRIALEVEDLKNKFEKFQHKNLQQNENFISTLQRSLIIAQTTHSREKLEALKNAVINSVLVETVDESMKSIFLSLIESLTPWHLSLLNYFNNPRIWFTTNKIDPPRSANTIRRLVTKAFPDIEKDFLNYIVTDLNQRGLLGIKRDSLGMMLTPEGIYHSGTTAFGKNFLQFIAAYNTE